MPANKNHKWGFITPVFFNSFTFALQRKGFFNGACSEKIERTYVSTGES